MGHSHVFIFIYSRLDLLLSESRSMGRVCPHLVSRVGPHFGKSTCSPFCQQMVSCSLRCLALPKSCPGQFDLFPVPSRGLSRQSRSSLRNGGINDGGRDKGTRDQQTLSGDYSWLVVTQFFVSNKPKMARRCRLGTHGLNGHTAVTKTDRRLTLEDPYLCILQALPSLSFIAVHYTNTMQMLGSAHLDCRGRRGLSRRKMKSRFFRKKTQPRSQSWSLRLLTLSRAQKTC